MHAQKFISKVFNFAIQLVNWYYHLLFKQATAAFFMLFSLWHFIFWHSPGDVDHLCGPAHLIVKRNPVIRIWIKQLYMGILMVRDIRVAYPCFSMALEVKCVLGMTYQALVWQRWKYLASDSNREGHVWRTASYETTTETLGTIEEMEMDDA